jgi:hypothetical protein
MRHIALTITFRHFFNKYQHRKYINSDISITFDQSNPQEYQPYERTMTKYIAENGYFNSTGLDRSTSSIMTQLKEYFKCEFFGSKLFFKTCMNESFLVFYKV